MPQSPAYPTRSADLEFDSLKEEVKRLRRENAVLRERLGREYVEGLPTLPGHLTEVSATVQPVKSAVHADFGRSSPTIEKISLFLSLFRGQDDVHARRWENAKGKSGYAPACANEWQPRICQKPRIKCAECKNQTFLPLDNAAAYDHLAGRKTIGVYPLLKNETCWFLAIDFDEGTWREDVRAFVATCRDFNVPASMEISRSGKGAHAWVFFADPVPSRLARELGSAMITRTCARARHLSLRSYDRMFPNQDTLPKGGFGNLIALPLQKGPRDHGCSVFVDANLEPYRDQWAYLATIPRMTVAEVESAVGMAMRSDGILGLPIPVTDEREDDPWTLPPSPRRLDKPIAGPFPASVKVTISNLVYVEKEGLSQALVNRIIRVAAFQNPEFYKAQAMRLPTFDKPRVIGCAEDYPRHIGLPRGCMDELSALFQACGIRIELVDQRFHGTRIEVDFQGQLTDGQTQAVSKIRKHESGVLVAPTAFGKTVVAAAVIAERKVNTLVLVHRRQLVDQWRERLSTFLTLLKGDLGMIGGGKHNPTGVVDIAVMQSLYRENAVDDIVAAYGQVIVDECHHVSAFSFEQILKVAKARFVLGLTATPTRRDGHHPIIMMQCGPIRHRPQRSESNQALDHWVIPKSTGVQISDTSAGIQNVYKLLTRDDMRNKIIVEDVREALTARRKPLVLTERTEHVLDLADRLKDVADHVIVLHGRLGRRQRNERIESLARLKDQSGWVLIATGRLIGEGFDHAPLDTLFLALPISWRGTLQQYAGRLHRTHADKTDIRIYDYVDDRVAVLAKMYERRLRGYRAMGYTIRDAAVESGPNLVTGKMPRKTEPHTRT